MDKCRSLRTLGCFTNCKNRRTFVKWIWQFNEPQKLNFEKRGIVSYVKNDSRKIKTVYINRFIKVTKYLLVRLGKFNFWISMDSTRTRLFPSRNKQIERNLQRFTSLPAFIPPTRSPKYNSTSRREALSKSRPASRTKASRRSASNADYSKLKRNYAWNCRLTSVNNCRAAGWNWVKQITSVSRWSGHVMRARE